MKKIQYASDFHRIKSLIDDSQSGSHEICLWQKNPASQKRIIHNMKVDRNLFGEKKFWMQSTHSNQLKFTQDVTFYYCHELKCIFKTILVTKEDTLICLNYPDEVTLLDEEDNFIEEFTKKNASSFTEDFTWVKSKKTTPTDETTVVKGNAQDDDEINRISGTTDHQQDENTLIRGSKDNPNTDVLRVKGQALGSEKEAEKLFAAQRESTRLAPKDDKFVTLVRDSHPGEQEEFKLFDLSQGGAGLLIFSPSKFKIGEAISIIAIDKKPIDKILIGSVVAIRPYDEGKGEWKLGIKFS